MSKQQTVFLLVDDDSDDVELFGDALSDISKDYYFYSAEDGAAALKKLRDKQHPKPSFIFLDINMPGMGGWEFLSFIKKDEELRHIPVIVYSTSSHPHDIEKALKGGAMGFFRKPDSMRELTDVLAKISKTPVSDMTGALAKAPGLWFTKAGAN